MFDWPLQLEPVCLNIGITFQLPAKCSQLFAVTIIIHSIMHSKKLNTLLFRQVHVLIQWSKNIILKF